MPLQSPLLIFFTFAAILLSSCTQTSRKFMHYPTDTPKLSADIGPDESRSLATREPQDLVNTGYAYLASGDPTLARMHFVTALQKDPDLADAYNGLGKTEYLTGNYPAALTVYERASALQPENLDSLLGQAQTLRQMNKLDTAISKINVAMKLAPNDLRVLNELAITYDLQGQERLASPIYQELVKMAPDQASTFNNLGVNHISLRQYPEAVAAFHRAYELDNRDMRIKNNLAMAFALQGSEEQALRIFKETVGEAAAWNNLGYLYLTQKRYDDAERALNKAMALNPRFYPKAQENLERLRRFRQSER